MSRGGVQGFQKDRLGQILAARRLTQVQLASMVEVSPATISKWRAGTQAPERDALDRLAGVVNVTPEWFTRAPGAKLSLPLFRSNASAHVAARAMLEARLEWAQAKIEFVERTRAVMHEMAALAYLEKSEDSSRKVHQLVSGLDFIPPNPHIPIYPSIFIHRK